MADVFLGFLHPNEVAASFHKSLLDLIGYDMASSQRLASWAQIKCGAGGIAEGRNEMAAAFLGSDSEWLFMVDADMGFEADILDKLLAVADAKTRPIIGGLAFAQREIGPDGMSGFNVFPAPTIFDLLEHADGHHRFTGRNHYPVNTLIRAGATGGAVVLIHRTVIEAIAAADIGKPFDPIPDPDPAKGKMGEDISFFVRTESLGIPLHIHTGVRTSHFKSRWLAESDFWQFQTAPPATERVDVLIPVLHRPQNVKPLMDSLRASTGLADAWFIVEDEDVDEIEAVIINGGRVLSSPDAHTFAEKINYGFSMTAAPWVLLVGDDVRFHPGWFDQAVDVANRYQADVIATNDGLNPRVMRGEHATHPLIRRSYVDELGASWDGPGIVCHEGYSHWFVDDEITTVARMRQTFQPALASLVEHLHPLGGKVETDEIYELGQKNAKADQALFAKRLKANTGR